LIDSSKNPSKRSREEVNKPILGMALVIPIIGTILIVASLLAPSTTPSRDLALVVGGGVLVVGGLVIREYLLLPVERVAASAEEAQRAAEDLAAIGRAQAEHKQKLEEESKERERQERLIKGYHDELIAKVYNPWCQAVVEARSSLAGYPPSQNQPEYAWIPIGFEVESTSEPTTHPELATIADALAHLDGTTSEARKKVWDGVVDYNNGVKALIRWPSYIAKVIESECGLKVTAGNGQTFQEPGCDASALMEYFDRHFYRREEGTLGPTSRDSSSSTGRMLLPIHYAGLTRTLASSSDGSELTRLMKKVNPWGEYYADARRSLDSKRELLTADLKTFQNGIAQVIQTMKFRPQLVKSRCSIEESFAERKR
jgi:hypothetical protein